MSVADLDELARRLEQVENALADAQARVPALRREVREIRQQLASASPETASRGRRPAGGEDPLHVGAALP